MKAVNWFWLLLTLGALSSGLFITAGIFAMLLLLSFGPPTPWL